MPLFAGSSHKIPGSIIEWFVTTMDKFRFIIFQKQVLAGTQKIIYSGKLIRKRAWLSEILVQYKLQTQSLPLGIEKLFAVLTLSFCPTAWLHLGFVITGK